MSIDLMSFSRADKANKCWLFFYLSYVLGFQAPPSQPLVEGKSIHSVIELMLTANNPDPGFVRQVCNTVAGLAPIKVDAEELFYMAQRPEVLQYIGLGGVLEEYFKAPLDPTNPFSPEMRGFIDWHVERDDHVLLVDWKSNRKAYEATETYQLALYAGYLMGKYQKPVKGRLVFVRLGEVSSHVYTEDEISEARRWVHSTAERIQDRIYKMQNGEDRRKVFPATPGDHCRWCDWADYCDESEVHLPDIITDLKTADAVAREILRTEQQCSLLKDRLKAYVQQHGDLEIDGVRKFTMAPSKYWKWPAKSLHAAVAAMEEEGTDPLSILSLTAAGLRKLRWGEDRLQALGANPRETFRFTHRAIK